MKNIILAVLIAGCAALGVVCFVQGNKLQKQSAQLAQANQQLADLQANLKEKTDEAEAAKAAAARADILQKTLTESTTAAVEQSKKTEELQQTISKEKTNNPLHSVVALFKDPKMREMMKSQQKAVMGPIINKQYSDLIKQLNLTPDQAGNLKDLIEKRMLSSSDTGLSMLDDSLDASQRADLAKQVKTQNDEVNGEIKDLLGDQNYQAFQTYEKTLPDRSTVSDFSNEFAGTSSALSADQQSQLVQSLNDARNNFKWTSGLNQQDPAANSDFGSMLTDDKIDQFVQEREQFDQQFLSRAQQILTPEQLKAYEEFQARQRQVQIAGLKMAKQMFGK